MICRKNTVTYITFSCFLFLFLFLLLPVYPVAEAACLGGNAHEFGSSSQCGVCGISAAAQLGDCYYSTIGEALADARDGDTVSVFYDPSTEAKYEIGEGIMLDCEGAVIYTALLNRGRITGGTFMKEVENHGVIEGATIYSLLTYGDSEVYGAQLSGTLSLYGGRVTGGKITSLTAKIHHEPDTPLPTVDLTEADLTDAALTLVNKSGAPLPTDWIILPDGYALLLRDGSYADNLPIDGEAPLSPHTHSFSAALLYDDGLHFSACDACGYRAPTSVGAHLLSYTDLENGMHSAACDLCGYEADLEHYGGRATCTTPARCSYCRASYGEPDPAYHSGGSDNGFCTHCGGYHRPTRVTERNYASLGLTPSHIGCYAIGSAGELYWFAENASTTDSAVLTASITVDAATAALHPWIPMAADGFCGCFDGNGKTIAGLRGSAAEDCAGLFFSIGEGGSVKDLGLIDSHLSAQSIAGGIAAILAGGRIERCYTNLTAEGGSAGGIVGVAIGGEITSTLTLGGGMPIGILLSTTVRDCYYMADHEAGDTDGIIARSHAAIRSGEVAYLLGAPFTQDIGIDAHPRFGAATVYCVLGCDGISPAYSNTEGNIEHAPSPEGQCTACGYRYAAVCQGIFYDTLAMALAVARDGDTVTLLCDNAEATVTVGRGITLDARDHAIHGNVTCLGALIGGHYHGAV